MAQDDDKTGEVASIWPPDRSAVRLAQVERIRVLKQEIGKQIGTLPTASDADARLVARMILLLEEVMEIARQRSGEEGRALIDNLAVEIFRVISSGRIRADPGAADPGRAGQAEAGPPPRQTPPSPLRRKD